MQELDKILEEINEEIKASIAFSSVFTDGLCRARNIIRKHMNDGWISVDEQLPEEKVNPVSQDFYEYQVTAKFGNVKDVRHYKYGNGHWWNGPGIVDKYVITWRENPEPYRPERSKNA